MKYSFLIEAADCCSNILSQFRIDAGLSRKDMSQVMDVSETTIKAWETGQGSPTLLGMLLWFQATGNSAAPPLVKLFWPDEIGNTSIHSSYDEIRSALAYYLANLASPEEVAKLHYLVYGGHGSSWLGLLDMGLAHVNASLDSRVRIRETIMTSYSLCEVSGRLQTPPGLSVNRAVIESVKVAAQDAVAGHLQGDTITPVTQSLLDFLLTGGRALPTIEADDFNDAVDIRNNALDNNRSALVLDTIKELSKGSDTFVDFLFRHDLFFCLCRFLSKFKQEFQKFNAGNEALLMLFTQSFQLFAKTHKLRIVGVLQDFCDKVNFDLLCSLLQVFLLFQEVINKVSMCSTKARSLPPSTALLAT